ncbi:MAG: hypothetical protein ACTSWN_05620 [Promethearchaeota archaeon]
MPSPPCPECGGKTRFDPSIKRIICESCGLALTRKEFEELRLQLRKEIEMYDDERLAKKRERERKRKLKDYQKWWESSHSEE